MDGILNINKPAGRTSFDIVAMVRRLAKERHTGHAGTLDPNASGVLPVCLGKSTRIVEFLMDAHKVYRAVIELGITTDTYDAEGKVTRTADASTISKDLLEQALDTFRGSIQQTPPMYSALKHQGQPLYALAREGISIERKSRPVTIHDLKLINWQMLTQPLVTLEIECSKGTYIRSIANDLGEMLGCGAYLKGLVRSGYGIFKLEDAISPEQLEEAARGGNLEKHLHPTDSVLGHMPFITVDEVGQKAIKTGNPPKTDTNDAAETGAQYCRAYNAEGQFLAIMIRDKEYSVWRPKKVFI